MECGKSDCVQYSKGELAKGLSDYIFWRVENISPAFGMEGLVRASLFVGMFSCLPDNAIIFILPTASL